MSGLAAAFCTLDKTRSESEQAAYLLRYGSHAVIRERMHSVEYAELVTEPPDNRRFDEEQFLGRFDGDKQVHTVLLAIIEGRSLSTTEDAIRWTLRQNNITCGRATAREVKQRILKGVRI